MASRMWFVAAALAASAMTVRAEPAPGKDARRLALAKVWLEVNSGTRRERLHGGGLSRVGVTPGRCTIRRLTPLAMASRLNYRAHAEIHDPPMNPGCRSKISPIRTTRAGHAPPPSADGPAPLSAGPSLPRNEGGTGLPRKNR